MNHRKRNELEILLDENKSIKILKVYRNFIHGIFSIVRVFTYAIISTKMHWFCSVGVLTSVSRGIDGLAEELTFKCCSADAVLGSLGLVTVVCLYRSLSQSVLCLITKIVPIHKKRCSKNRDNYRPIVIFSVLFKNQ